MDIAKLIEENKKSIREDESRKQQALEQFRDWINKHPFISSCRQDDSYLLQFLRTKKFSMDDAFKVFENQHLIRATRPDWFDTSDNALEKFRELCKTNAAYMLRKRAADGSVIFVMNFEKIDVDKHKTSELFNYVFNACIAYMELEENQVLGFTYILNYVNCPLKVITSFSIRDSAQFVGSTNKCPGRNKKYILVGLPAAANALLNAAKTVMTEKQKNRLLLLKDYDELAQHVDKSVLTDHFGGAEPEGEVVSDFLKVVETNFPKMQNTNKFELDMEKAGACRNLEESIGSFRSLEID